MISIQFILTLLFVNFFLSEYAMSEGLSEFIDDNSKKPLSDNSKYKFTKLYNFRRFTVYVASSALFYFTIGWYWLLFLLSNILSYAYFHRKSYQSALLYSDRKISDLDVSLEKYKSIYKFMMKNRITMLVIGLAIQVFTILFLL